MHANNCIVSIKLENLKEKIDAENQKKSDALKGLSKATAEAQLWRSKYETEGLGHVEELEAGRQKLSARLNEAEETIDTLNAKVAATEKTKHRLETELEDLQLEYERVHAAAIITERRGKNFDKVTGYLIFFSNVCHQLFCFSKCMLIEMFLNVLYRLSANGRLSLMTLPPKLMLAKRNAETTTANFSALKLPGMKQWNNWM